MSTPISITVSALLAATLVVLDANAQAESETADKSGQAEVTEATCAGASPAAQGTAIKVDEGSVQRHLVAPRPTRIQASRPPSRIVTIDPLLPFGQ